MLKAILFSVGFAVVCQCVVGDVDENIASTNKPSSKTVQKLPNPKSSQVSSAEQVKAGIVAGVSPSGRFIVCKAKANDLHQIVELKTGKVTGSFDALSNVGCNWSADEAKLMVAGRSGHATFVTIVNAKGISLHHWSTRIGGHLEMSPAGNRILFSAEKLHMTDLSGNVLESFKAPTERFRGWGVPSQMSSWSPDGSEFAFYDEAASDVLFYSLDGGKPLKRINVKRPGYMRFVWLPSGRGFSCLHDVYDFNGKARPLAVTSVGDVRVFSPDETAWATTGGAIGRRSGRVINVNNFYQNGFLFWNEADVITSVDRDHPGRFREFSPAGELIREVAPQVVANPKAEKQE